MEKEKIRIYGYGLGQRKEDLKRCVESVSEPGRYGSFHPHQCYRKRGFGKDGLYCKQHAKMNNN